MATTPRRCLVCDQLFIPPRSDARTCRPACRQKAYRRRLHPPKPVYTTITGTNAALIAEVARVYPLAGRTVADVTYRTGVFWRKMDPTTFTLLKSDLQPRAADLQPRAADVQCADLRALPYADASIDVVVLDPPYMHDPGRTQVDYGNHETTRGMSHQDIIALYAAGLAEAWRVLKPGGWAWVKCKDEISGGKQWWSHIEIQQHAVSLGYDVLDLFHFLARGTVQHKRQQHARKDQSYLWVFVKPKPARGLAKP